MKTRLVLYQLLLLLLLSSVYAQDCDCRRGAGYLDIGKTTTGTDYLFINGTTFSLDATDFTINFWASIDTDKCYGTECYFFAQGAGGNLEQTVLIDYVNNPGWNPGTSAMLFGFWGNDLFYNIPAATIRNVWDMWTFTWQTSTSTRRIYRNGVLGASGTSSRGTSGNGRIWIGKKFDFAETTYGSLDEYRVYRRLLSDSEIQNLYNSPCAVTVATTNLVLYLPFNYANGTVTSAVVADQSVSAFTAHRFGNLVSSRCTATCNYTGSPVAFSLAQSTVSDLTADNALDMRLFFNSNRGYNTTDFVFTGASTRCNSAATTNGAWTTTNGVADCTRTHSYVSDLNQALQFCNFARNEGLRNANTVTYRTTIMITATGLTKRIRGTDIYSSFQTSVTVDIDFLNNVTVASGNLSVFAGSGDSTLTFARVLNQVYDANTATATLTIFTSTSWPYQLTLNTFSTDPNWSLAFAFTSTTYRGPNVGGSSNVTSRCDDGTLAAVSGISGTDGTYNAGNPCGQFWTVVLRRTLNCPTATSLARTGWTLNYTVGCHSLYTGACGFTAGDPSSSTAVVFDTNSDNVCPVLLDTESVTASVSASGSNYGGAAISQYVFGARTYLQVNVNSPIRLERTIIERITIVSGAPTNNMVIYTNLLSAAGSIANHRTCQMPSSCPQGVFSVMTPASNVAPTLIDVQDSPSGNANVSQASWIWSSVTSAATGDNPTPVIVRVEVRVRFLNQSTVADRRLVLTSSPVHLMADNGVTSAAETSFDVVGANVVNNDNSNNNNNINGDTSSSTSSASLSSGLMVMGIVGAVVGVLAMVAAAALVIVNRRREHIKKMRTQESTTNILVQ